MVHSINMQSSILAQSRGFPPSVSCQKAVAEGAREPGRLHDGRRRRQQLRRLEAHGSSACNDGRRRRRRRRRRRMRRPHPRLIVFVVCGAIDEGRVVIVIVISLPCNRHSRVQSERTLHRERIEGSTLTRVLGSILLGTSRGTVQIAPVNAVRGAKPCPARRVLNTASVLPPIAAGTLGRSSSIKGRPTLHVGAEQLPATPAMLLKGASETAAHHTAAHHTASRRRSGHGDMHAAELILRRAR